jgi:hypothetical protein
MTKLPPFLSGLCLAAVPAGSLVPLTAFFAATGCALVLRSAYDVAIPIPVGDERETGRHLLQWCLVVGLTALLALTLNAVAGVWFVPKPDGFAPWLWFILSFDGAMLVLRYTARIVSMQLSAAPGGMPPIPELVARLPVDPTLPTMEPLEPVLPDPWRLSRSNVPGVICGALMLGLAIAGWNTQSLCLLRLPP